MLDAATPLRLRLSAAGAPGRGALSPEVLLLLPDLEESRIYQTCREFRVRNKLPEDYLKLFLPPEETELHQLLVIVRKRAVLIRPGVTKESQIGTLLCR